MIIIVLWHGIHALKQKVEFLPYLFPAGMHRPDITEHCDHEVSYTLPGSSTGLEVRGFKVQ